MLIKSLGLMILTSGTDTWQCLWPYVKCTNLFYRFGLAFEALIHSPDSSSELPSSCSQEGKEPSLAAVGIH